MRKFLLEFVGDMIAIASTALQIGFWLVVLAALGATVFFTTLRLLGA